MRPTAKLVCYAAALLLGAGLAGRAEALRCGSRVVDRGTLDVQVLRRCGEPYWRREQVEWIIAGDGTPIERRTERVTEHWFYNFGPRRLLVRLRFIDGVLDEERAFGYGASSVGGRCDAIALSRGTDEGTLVLRCGPPIRRRATYADQVLRDGFGGVRVQPRVREEWWFNRDDSSLLARVTLSESGIESVQDVRP